MHIECMVMHDVQNESLVFLYQLGTLSPLPSGEKEVSQTPHWVPGCQTIGESHSGDMEKFVAWWITFYTFKGLLRLW